MNNYFVNKISEIRTKYNQELVNFEAARKISFFVINEIENGLRYGKLLENGFVRFKLDNSLLKNIGVIQSSEIHLQLSKCIDFFNGFGINAEKDSEIIEKEGFVYFLDVKP
ncbi:MAG: hypothetical protein WCX20_01075 [Candidatus Shapirobacteria bacterium]